jgi:hypothetical protein
MNKWFTEYFAYLYFPSKSLRRRERKKKIDIEQIAKFLPNNNSIWIYDSESLEKVNRLNIKQENITVLHYSASDKGSFYNFKFPKIFRNIRTLILKSTNPLIRHRLL